MDTDTANRKGSRIKERRLPLKKVHTATSREEPPSEKNVHSLPPSKGITSRRNGKKLRCQPNLNRFYHLEISLPSLFRFSGHAYSADGKCSIGQVPTQCRESNPLTLIWKPPASLRRVTPVKTVATPVFSSFSRAWLEFILSEVEGCIPCLYSRISASES